MAKKEENQPVAKQSQNVTTSDGYNLSSTENQDDDFDIFDKSAEFMKQFEGYTPVAKWDYKQWSIGYGTKSYQGETITQEEALERYKQEIKQAYDRCNIGRFSQNKNMQVAFISFCYNVGHLPKGVDWYVDNGYINALKNQMKRYVYCGGDVCKGLVKRRNAETNLF